MYLKHQTYNSICFIYKSQNWTENAKHKKWNDNFEFVSSSALK